MTIALVGVISVGATSAVFTSSASVVDNTFATGVLDININGTKTYSGFNFGNAAPGDSYSGSFTIRNNGAPFFGGPSTLEANSIVVSAAKTGGNTSLFNKLMVKVESTVGWNNQVVFDGYLKDLVNKQILLPGNSLPTGWSMPMDYTVTLPAGVGNGVMGTSTTFDFVVDATT